MAGDHLDGDRTVERPEAERAEAERTEAARAEAARAERAEAQRAEVLRAEADQIGKSVRQLFLMLVGVGAFMFVTLQISDDRLIAGTDTVDLPWIEAQTTVSTLIAFGPLAITILLVYAHFTIGRLEEMTRDGVELPQVHVFTLRTTSARIFSDVVFYVYVPAICAWFALRTIFRPEAPSLLFLVAGTLLVCALLYLHRAWMSGPFWRRAAASAYLVLALALVGIGGYAYRQHGRLPFQYIISRIAPLDLERANLSQLSREVNLSGFNLDGICLRRANLRGMDLSGTSLRGADLSEARLDFARLEGADLTGAILDSATLNGTSLERAVLYKANMSRLSGTDARFTGAKLSEAELGEAVLPKAIFIGATARGTDFSGAEMPNASFSGATITNAEFGGAFAPAAIFNRAEAGGASFCQATLRGSKFINAKLHNADFSKADLTGASFGGAEIPGANFAGAITEGTLFTSNRDRDREAPLCAAGGLAEDAGEDIHSPCPLAWFPEESDEEDEERESDVDEGGGEETGSGGDGESAADSANE